MTHIPFYSDSIPIVFSTNDYFVPYMSTAMQSIMENADQNRQYVFYIFYQKIADENIRLLTEQTSFFRQFSIEFINVALYISKYNLFTSRHITVESYFRLLIPGLLSQYQKAIYLDGDIICNTDIASLFDIDMENNLIAAVRDTGVSWYYSPKHSKKMKNMHTVLLNLKKPDKYFCAAMTIINIELFHKTITTEKLLEFAASREWQIHDQDVMNVLSEGKTLLLPYCWNFMSTPDAKYLPEHLKKEYDEAGKNPKIVHYKPWDSYFYMQHFECFWKYATRTPFINIIVEQMNSKKLIPNSSFALHEVVIDNITHRKGIGIRFLLIDCIKAWLFRDKL